MIRLYRLLSRFLGPLIHLYLRYRRWVGKEEKGRFKERFGYPSLPRPDKFLLWIHGASVGEAMSALSLIKVILEKYPELHILMTTGTVASARMIMPYLPPQVRHQYLPVDLPSTVTRFLDYWAPNLGVWIESELWPNILYELQKRRIPHILINGRLSDRSYKRWTKAPLFIKQLLLGFAAIFPQSFEASQKFTALGVPSVKAFGNIKFAATPLSYQEEECTSLKHQLGSRPVWLAASTHKGEEEIVAKVHKSLKEAHPRLLTIVVPRHPDRRDQILPVFQEMGLNTSLRSQKAPLQEHTEVYIADTMGELGLFYKLIPIVFVGGSLVPVGGHNLIEPACFGCAVLHGPYMFKSKDLLYIFREAGASLQVEDGKALTLAVKSLLEDPIKLENIGQAAKRTASKGTEILKLVFQELNQHIAPFLDHA